MAALTEKEVEACKQAKLFIEEYLAKFADNIRNGWKPNVAHHEAVVKAQFEFPVVD